MSSVTLVKKFCSDASQAFLADIPNGSFLFANILLLKIHSFL